jgi:FtsH-binding integral membrane protein
VGIFWVNKIYYLVIAGAGALLFSIYLIYDMQLIMGGKSEGVGRAGRPDSFLQTPATPCLCQSVYARCGGAACCSAAGALQGSNSVHVWQAGGAPDSTRAVRIPRWRPPTRPPLAPRSPAGVELSPDEYIFAALTLYIDIVAIFLYLLQVVGISRSL